MKKYFILFQALGQHGITKKLPAFLRMIKSIRNSEYKPEVKSILLPALAIAYIISPIDILPDWIPFIGQLDDLALLAFVIPMLSKEIDRYIDWENAHSTDGVTTPTGRTQEIEDAQVIK